MSQKYIDSLNEAIKLGCNGFGFLVCFCGGDLCCCGLDGEVCPGCNDCEGTEEDWQQELDTAQNEYIGVQQTDS